MVFKNSFLQKIKEEQNSNFENENLPVLDLDEILKIKKRIIKNAKIRAKRKKKIFKLRDFNFQLPRICRFSKEAIDYKAPARSPYGPTLILIDAAGDYRPGNVEVVSYGGAASWEAHLRWGTPPLIGVSEPIREDGAGSSPRAKFSRDPNPLLKAFLELGRRALSQGWSYTRFEATALRLCMAFQSKNSC